MKNRNRFVYFLREVAIVVIGVLIAVSLGNLKEKMDNDNYIEKTLLAIESEIRLSQEEVDTVLNKHYALVDSLENYAFDNEQTLGEMMNGFGGFQVALIKNVSLRFFISNKAELLDFKLIAQLLEIENQSTMLSDKINRLGDFAYEHINDRTDESKITFAYLLANVIDSEEALMESYANFLDENKAYLNDKSQ